MTLSISARNLKKSIYSIAAVLLFVVLFCCFFYLFLDHQYLVHWYLWLNSCFYRSDVWATDFFTPRIKSDGNMYAIIAIALCSVGGFYVARQRRRLADPSDVPVTFSLSRADMVYIAACMTISVGFWLWGNSRALPAYDEVFSAQNIAGINHFQGWAYYVLPNNHLLFNLLNGSLFHFVGDKVITGRILSLWAYCGVSVALFLWFRELMKSRLLALLAAGTLSLQFFVWAFGFQARGYEMYLLAEWGTFLSAFYYLQHAQTRWAFFCGACCAIGYCIMPSFFYFHAGVMLFMLVFTVVRKSYSLQFWKYQLMAMIVTYLFYLPALCFSGLEAITGNGYVLPMQAAKTVGVFWEWLFPYFNGYIVHIFSDVRVGTYSINTWLFFLPLLLLLFRRSKPAMMVGAFFLCLWLTTFIVVTVMRRPAFERNFIGHYSITMAAVLVLIWHIANRLKGVKTSQYAPVIFGLLSISFAIHFSLANNRMLIDVTYEYNVNETYNMLNRGLKEIPQGSTMSYSDEAFYCGYIAGKNGCKVNACPVGNEMFFIKKESEELPAALEDDHLKVWQVNEYEVYKRK